MTLPAPPIPPDLASSTRPADVTARLRGLARLKLTEPVRLYAYGVLSAVLVALVLVGTITQDWSAALTGIAAALLGVPGVEAARATVYSPATHVAEVYQAVQVDAADLEAPAAEENW